jgi:hypothetical protein
VSLRVAILQELMVRGAKPSIGENKAIVELLKKLLEENPLRQGLVIVDKEGFEWRWNQNTGKVLCDGDDSIGCGYHSDGWEESVQELIDGGYIELEALKH